MGSMVGATATCKLPRDAASMPGLMSWSSGARSGLLHITEVA